MALVAAKLEDVRHLADLFRRRNEIDAEIAALINRPAERGHIGEWLAAAIFDIELNPSATHKGVDGRFHSGVLAGRTVNIKFYGKQESLLDMVTSGDHPDHYLVLTGGKGAAIRSIGRTRPLCIEYVYLFDGPALHRELDGTCKIGVATSVRKHFWEQAEIYPQDNALLLLTEEQRQLLAHFCESSES